MPPENGESSGPVIEASSFVKESPRGQAPTPWGGSLSRSSNSRFMRLASIFEEDVVLYEPGSTARQFF